MIKKIKNYFITALCFAACASLCMMFETVSCATLAALNLCAKIILPSLFPFFIVSDLLMSHINFDNKGIAARIVTKIFKLPPCALGAFAIGLISGYPVGASAVMRLYENNCISKKDAEHLICFTNNSGPLFLVCSVGCGMFGSLNIGIMLYCIHVFTAIITSLIAGRMYTFSAAKSNNSAAVQFNLALSVERAFMQCLKITAFVVFFAITNEFVLKFADCISAKRLSPLAHVCLLSVFEMTNAVSRAAALLPTAEGMCVTSFAAAWAGLSVLFQVKSVTKNMLSLKKYIKYKFFSGLAAALITSSILKIGKIKFNISMLSAGSRTSALMMLLCAIIGGIYYAKKRCRKNDIS